MAGDFKASQVQTNKIIVTGSFANQTTSQLLVYNYSAQDTGLPNNGLIDPSKFDTSGGIGTDVFLFVSGGISKKDAAYSNAVSVFGGDVHISGNLTVNGSSPGGGGGSGNQYWFESGLNNIFSTGSAEITGSLIVKSGISGSLTRLTDGSSYLVAGANIVVSSASNGSVTISSTASGNGQSFYRLEVVDYASVDSTISTSVGQVIFPANEFSGSLTLRGVIANSNSLATGSIQLFNITSGTYVHIGGPGVTHIYSTGTIPTIVNSVNLYNAANFNNVAQSVYELQASSSNGLYTTILGGFELRPSGSFTGVTYSTSSYYYTYTSGTWEDGVDRLATTSSVAIAGNLGTSYFADSIGNDAFFFVSGANGSKDGSVPGVAVFGGDVVISGTLHGGSPLKVGSAANFFNDVSISLKLQQGSDVSATGDYSHAQGQFTSAQATGSHAEGNNTTASGLYAHSEGSQTTASGEASHAEGVSTNTFGLGSHAEGFATAASGSYSHAEGAYSTASGNYSHAEGSNTVTLSDASHAEGNETSASGFASHAEGNETFAIGFASHAGNISTIASGSGQTAIGKYNRQNNDFSLFVVGDGTDDGNRSDIVRVNPGLSLGTGRLEITGTVASTLGLSGSLTKLTNGSSYIVAGTGISVTSASNGSVTIASSAATLQQSYNAGLPLIGLNNSSGSVTITGSLTPTDIYPSLLSLKPGFGGPYGSNYNAIDVYGWTTTEIQSASLINIRGNGSNAGGGQINLRSTGDVNGRIGWIAGSGQLYSSSPNASIQYHPNASSLKIANESSTGKVSIVNTNTGGQGLFVVQNGQTWLGGDKNDSAVRLFPDPVNPFMGVNTYGTVYNSGSLEQSGSASFKNKVEVTGSLSVSGSGGSNGRFSQFNGLKFYPHVITSLPYTASLGDYIIAVSASAVIGIGVALPSGVDFGTTFIIKDVSGSASSNNLRITANNGLIDGLSQYDIAIDYGSAQFVYFGSSVGWGAI